jgi:hypothetical protein
MIVPLFLKSTITRPCEDHDFTHFGVEHSEILMAIAVEVPRLDGDGPERYRKPCLGIKRSISAPQKNGDVARHVVCDSEIDLAVGVKVTKRNRGGPITDLEYWIREQR